MTSEALAPIDEDNDSTVHAVVRFSGATGALNAFEHAQMEVQKDDARNHPRSIERAQKYLLKLVTGSQEVAATMHYRLERKGKGSVADIEGESIRFAECVMAAYGNIAVDQFVLGVDDEEIIAIGTAIDLETNNRIRLDERKRIVDRNGRKYSGDMINMTGRAAKSTARRNAILALIPRAFWQAASDAAKVKAMSAPSSPIEVRRANALTWFARKGKKEALILDLLGLTRKEDISEDHLLTLGSVRAMVEEEGSHIDDALADAFDKPPAAARETAPLQGRLDG